MNPLIFKEYDIRGIVETDLPDDLVYKIGQSIGTEVIREGLKSINVGRDCRLTSDNLFDQLSKGIMSTGCNVCDIGVCTTPILYYSIYNTKTNGGVMITGSHNDKEYNGFKITVGKSSLYGEKIQGLRKRIETNDFETGEGSLTQQDLTESYINYLTDAFQFERPLKIVLDAGNGTGGEFALPILTKLGCQVIPLYCEMDGNFPNHHPDPTVPKNLTELIEVVKKEKADLGIAYDGDTDRIGAVDEKGNIVYCDSLMILYAQEILSRKPGATIISEVKSSKNMYSEIEKMGGNIIMWRTGHSLIKAKMKETGAELAGELSGHIFFKDRYFGYDDAIYATCRLIEILATSDKTFSEMLSHLPVTYTTPEIRIDCPDTIKFDVVAKATQFYKDQNYQVIDVDGARVTINGSWGLVRASNTSPCLVLRFESDEENTLEEIKNSFIQKVEALIQETQ